MLRSTISLSCAGGRSRWSFFTAQKPGLKVIYISGYSLQAVGKDFAILDGPNFLQKPFALHDLA